MAKPKLALLPAAQGSKLYSVLPSSGVGDFNFTRSSSATRINSQGLIETVASGVSRLNYPMIDGVVKGCPHHILEPQRSNLVTYSEAFDNSAWSKYSGATIVSNDAISPDGTLNAGKFTLGGGVFQQQPVSSNTDYCFSLFVKTDTADYVEINYVDQTSPYRGGTIRFTFNTKQITITEQSDNNSVSGDFKYYGNGWYRVIIKYKTNINKNYNYQQIDFNGNAWGFGAMLEQGSYPTSYIPTTTSAVTRSAETANGSGDAATFNDSEGVLMAEISALDNDSDTKRISLSDGTSSNRISLLLSDETIGGVVVSGGGVAVSVTVSGYDATLNNKILFKYKENDFSIFVNGFEVLTDTSGITPTGLNELRFDNGYSGNDFYGNTKQVQYYDTALTDSDLEKLTSWVSFTDMAESQLYSIE
mgnify:CR=1 FL=1